MESFDNLCVIIPAFNEERALGRVIEQVVEHVPGAAVVVVNDGSTDTTKEVAMREGAIVLNLPFNLGIGSAVQTGLKYALCNGYTFAAQVDADGQHKPSYLPKLLERLKDVDVVIGSRFVSKTGYRSTFLRRFGIVLFTILIRVAWGKTIFDATSGFRVYNHRALSFLAPHYPDDFPEPESIVLLLRNGFRIMEYPVAMQRRQGGISSIRHDFSFKAAYFVLTNAIAILVSSLKTRTVR